MHFQISGRLVCLLLLLWCQQAHAQVITPVKTSVNYDYLLYLPKDYEAGKGDWPLVIYLHGGSQSGKGGKDLAKLKTYGLPYQVEQGQNFNFIIASPQCPEGKYWSTDNWLDSLHADLTTKHRIDKKRIYLTGISMGGYGTWQTAVANPNMFAAIMPLCGGCDDSTQICRIKNVPVWAFHGAADDLVPIDETARLVKRLNQCGGHVKFTKLEKEGHSIQHLYGDSRLYEWLLKQHK